MFLAVVALLIQAAPPEAAERPILIWLGSSGPVTPGERVQVFVKTTGDGYLTVLRRTTDGRIEVLFPTNPSDEVFVPRGTYEVRKSVEGGAFVAVEPPGTGLVLAALSSTRFRPQEFVHQAAWNAAALVPSWSEADAEGALTDIIQRMLGDGYFVYDIVEYTVAPRAMVPHGQVAASPAYEPCWDCAFPSVTIIIVPSPVLVCDPFFVVCEDFVFFPHRRLGPPPQQPGPAEGRVLGIPSRSRVVLGIVARQTERPRFVTPDRPASPPPIAPRSRVPDHARSVAGAVPARAIPVLRGMRTGRVADARPGAVAPRGREVRLVMPRTRPRTDAAPPAPTRVTLAAVSAAPVVAPRTPEAAVAITPRSALTLAAVPAMVVPARQTGAGPVERSASSGAGVRAQGHGSARVMAAPRGVESRARARAATVGVRRRE